MNRKNVPFQQEPVVTTTGDRSVTTHPAFAQISASRVNGRSNLYGSDFTHNGFISIAIKKSELHRSLSNDWYFDREQLIEIALSEAQWASLVSSLNIGSGVPCTLEWMKDEGRIPQLPDPESRADQFGMEFQKDFEEALESLDTLARDLESSGLSKKKIAEMTAQVRRAKAQISSSAPFVVKQFGEHMEAGVEKAKAEVHGYIQTLTQRIGERALASPEGPLALSARDDNNGL